MAHGLRPPWPLCIARAPSVVVVTSVPATPNSFASSLHASVNRMSQPRCVLPAFASCSENVPSTHPSPSCRLMVGVAAGSTRGVNTTPIHGCSWRKRTIRSIRSGSWPRTCTCAEGPPPATTTSSLRMPSFSPASTNARATSTDSVLRVTP